MYDSLQRRWLPARPVGEDLPVKLQVDIGMPLIDFDDSEEWVVACARAPAYSPSQILVVFGMHQPTVSLVARLELYSLRWLPGTTSLLLRGPLGLARLDLDIAALPDTLLLELD